MGTNLAFPNEMHMKSFVLNRKLYDIICAEKNHSFPEYTCSIYSGITVYCIFSVY
jgi:hypothetical protein